MRMRGDAALFASEDAVEAAWRVVDPVLGDSASGRNLRTRHLGACIGRAPSSPATKAGTTRSRKRARRAESEGASDVVFLLDVDNTLLDNDRFKADLDARLLRDFGAGGRDRYWACTKASAHGWAMRITWPRLQASAKGWTTTRTCCRCPPSCSTIRSPSASIRARSKRSRTCARSARRSMLSDGDIVFQPRKVQRSGVWDAVQGRVLIYLHKEHMLDAVQRRFPARHYVMVDDKPKLLAAMKTVMGERLTTVFVRQGHYAGEAARPAIEPPPDMVIDRIDALAGFDLQAFDLRPSPSSDHTADIASTHQESP